MFVLILHLLGFLLGLVTQFLDQMNCLSHFKQDCSHIGDYHMCVIRGHVFVCVLYKYFVYDVQVVALVGSFQRSR